MSRIPIKKISFKQNAKGKKIILSLDNLCDFDEIEIVKSFQNKIKKVIIISQPKNKPKIPKEKKTPPNSDIGSNIVIEPISDSENCTPEAEVSYCCGCGERCNPLSQICGRCARSGNF